MKTLKKYVIRTLIVLFVLAAAVGSFFTFVPFSEGMRAGQVIKLSKKGVIFKTHEGELTPNVWAFSVQNKEVADQILKASATGERLELYYKEKYFKFPWQGDTKYYVYRVESAPAVAPQFPTNIPIGGVNGGKPIEVK